MRTSAAWPAFCGCSGSTRCTRYVIAERARPFTLCLKCNLPLRPVARSGVAHRLPEKVLQEQQSFSHCGGCDRVYWPGSHYGSHYRRMRRVLDQAGLQGDALLPSA
jgi:hypothetical protein